MCNNTIGKSDEKLVCPECDSTEDFEMTETTVHSGWMDSDELFHKDTEEFARTDEIQCTNCGHVLDL